MPDTIRVPQAGVLLITLPSDSTSQWTPLRLANGWQLPAPIADFHRQVTRHAWRTTKYPLHFHRILRWVYADYDDRTALCKTGWKSWKKYGNLNVKMQEDVLYKSHYICLKCGKEIEKASRVKRLEYYSNCQNTIYLHNRCTL